MFADIGHRKEGVNMDINRALYEFGVRDDTLSDDEIASLDRNGFVRIENALTPEQVEAQRRRVDELVELEGEAAGLEVHKEEGTDRLGDLVNKDDVFDICFTHPKLLASIRHIVGGDFRMGALNARNVHPGYGHQAFHQDSGKPGTPGNYQYVNSIYFLVDFTEGKRPYQGRARIAQRGAARGRRNGRPDRRASERGASDGQGRDGLHLQRPPLARRDGQQERWKQTGGLRILWPPGRTALHRPAQIHQGPRLTAASARPLDTFSMSKERPSSLPKASTAPA